jgi:phosphoribosylformylglycinamidine (FGAM) synthase-like enzyme
MVRIFDSVFINEEGMRNMGIIVCQSCERTIEHFEEEKVTTLYAKCNSCTCNSTKSEK